MSEEQRAELGDDAPLEEPVVEPKKQGNTSRQNTRLAHEVLAEMTAENPDIDVAEWRRRVASRLVFDVEVAKAAAAYRACEVVHKEVTEKVTKQIPLPGMPPEPGTYLVWADGKMIECGSAEELHVDGADDFRYRHMSEAIGGYNTWRELIGPIRPYLRRGMNWTKAAEAYRNDHPDMVSD